MIEGLQMNKSEIRENVKDSLAKYLDTKAGQHGFCIVVLSCEDNIAAWGLYKVQAIGEKREKIHIESSDTETFFKKVILSQADNLAVKLQVKAVISTIGKKVFPEIEKAIVANLEANQHVMIAKNTDGLLVTLNENGRYIKSLDIDEIF